MGSQNQSFGAPQVAQSALGRMGRDGLAFDPEVARILQGLPGPDTGGGGQQTGMNFGSLASGGARLGSNALSTYSKLAPLLGGGSEAAIASGIGGAGSALSGGMAAGGTGLGVASPTAGMAGVLPGYTGTATGIFGSGAGASGAGASGAGGASSAGAAGAGGMALPVATALPMALAAYGMIRGMMGKGDNGTPQTQSQEAAAAALANNPQLYQQNPELFGSASLPQNFTADAAEAYQQKLRQAGGNTSGSLLGSYLSSNLMDNGGG